MKALVTGATGFVGRCLLARLEHPVVLSRNAPKAQKGLADFQVRAFAWDPMHSSPPLEAFEGVEVIFHLAGDPVAEGRWTDRKKVMIRDSRVLGTRHLVAALKERTVRPKVLISASAVGYYGTRGDEVLTERSTPGSGFLADVCKTWEHEAQAAQDLGIRVVPIRIGVVLGRAGGALNKMLTPFRLGLGSPLGSGRQFMPWIHVDDLVELMLMAAQQPTLAGPINGVAPRPVTNLEFTKTLGRVLSRPTFMPPIPGWAMKLLVGEFAEVLLASQRVIPEAAQDAGFVFRYPDLERALRAIVHPTAL